MVRFKKLKTEKACYHASNMRTDLHSFKRARAASRDEQAVWLRFIRTCKRNKTLRYIFIIILLLFVIFYIWADFLSENLDEVGDAFNILNTFFTALAFIGLIVTILLQRKDLALQREELRLQREEMQRQRAEQKRQADEFEAQNRLMKIQQFDSFFFKQLEYLNYLSDSIHFENKNGLEAISKIADCIYSCAKIVRCDNIADSLYSLNEEQQSEYDANWKMFEKIYNDLLPWVHKFYSFIRRIRNTDMLNDENKKFYIEMIFENLLDTQKYVLQVMGCVSFKEEYRVLERQLDDEDFFEKKLNDIFANEKNILIFQDTLECGDSFIDHMKYLVRVPGKLPEVLERNQLDKSGRKGTVKAY
ncbi:MAG: hypothetical protein ACLR2F_08380 [Akkermansia muciniphila]|uniref:hypothetical protein n=1 Tax=Akkermansia muciniphila TaxID=239935 RepID=UPI0027D31040|nr:hypothetical protein [Akkermansia muciniphila]WMB15287.1 hypothetical protein O4G22_11455 [Akkermansia muciniphila]WMB19858.1 hypothetical protein O4G19_12150 [Akkermansia muciniphila]